MLSKALANPSNTLKELYLWGNTIGNAGAADLAKVTHALAFTRERSGSRYIAVAIMRERASRGRVFP